MFRIDSRVPSLALLIAALGFAAGCNERDRIVEVPLDLRPHQVDGVYSVTGDGRVTVRWRANQEDDIDFYKVYRNFASTGTFTLIGTTPATQYVDTNVTNGQTYFYAVTAVDLAGQESKDLSFENVFDTPRPEGVGLSLLSTFVDDGASGLDLSDRSIQGSLDPQTDVYYAGQSGSYLIQVPSDTKIQDAGYIELQDLDFAPPAGWSADGVVEAIMGHSYIVYTWDGHYAKFEVTSRSAAAMTIDWAYQIDPDNPELAKGVRQ